MRVQLLSLAILTVCIAWSQAARAEQPNDGQSPIAGPAVPKGWTLGPQLDEKSIVGAEPTESGRRDPDTLTLAQRNKLLDDAIAADRRGDYAEEVKIYSSLARVGDAEGQALLGMMYRDGHGVPQDYKEAARWYRLASDQGDALGQELFGEAYQSGLGVPKDSKQATKWLRLAADQGLATAQSSLGKLLYQGQGMPRDFKESAKWFRLAADQNNAFGQRVLGTMYRDGLGVPKDYNEAASWLRRSADQGDALAQLFLGLLYFEGRGVPKDSKEAARLLRLASDQGDAGAQGLLGLMYRDGQGLPKDYVRAYMWLNLAAANGDIPASVNSDARMRDELAVAMTPAQIAEAQRLSSQWQNDRVASSQDAAGGRAGKSGGQQTGHGTWGAATNAPSAQNQPYVDTLLGSGFFVSEDGSALTNAHVVERCRDIRIASLVGAGTARIVARDSANDLALLATTLHPAAVAVWRSGVQQGEEVAIYGFPLAGLLANSGGITTGIVAALAGPADDSRLFQITAPVQPGNSGGPVLDRSGNVVGIVVSKLDALGVARLTNDIPENVGFAIKASAISSFLDGRKEMLKGVVATAPLSTPDIAAKARTFTVRIECPQR